MDVATEMRRAVSRFKAEAMDESGLRVDYALLRESDAYREYRATCTPLLPHLDLQQLDTRPKQLSFWINLYNALIVDAVITLGVDRSITEGRMGMVAFFRRAAYNVGGYRFNGETIEHGILRGNRGLPYTPGKAFGPSDPRRDCVIMPQEPRIHFALNCASRSCPPISVYDADSIEAQLDLAATNFIASEVTVEPERGQVRLSRIFQWYAGDFGGRDGVISLLLRYLPDGEARARLAAQRDTMRLVYRPYDWSLNV